MKTTFLYPAIALFILFTSCSSSKKNTTETKQVNPHLFVSNTLTPSVDGKANDWPVDYFNYNNSTKVLYAIANDNNNLYVLIRQADRNQQMKMINGGTEIWIDTREKKNKNLGVAFPLGGESMAPPAGGGEADKTALRLQLRSKMQNKKLIGFKDEFNRVQSAGSDSIVKTMIDWDSKDDLIYELAIPFSSLPGDITTSIENIAVGIFIKALKMPEDFSGSMPGGGRPGGGMPQGGMRPPGGGGGMPDRNQLENMTKDNSFWTKYRVTRK